MVRGMEKSVRLSPSRRNSRCFRTVVLVWYIFAVGMFVAIFNMKSIATLYT